MTSDASDYASLYDNDGAKILEAAALDDIEIDLNWSSGGTRIVFADGSALVIEEVL